MHISVIHLKINLVSTGKFVCLRIKCVEHCVHIYPTGLDFSIILYKSAVAYVQMTIAITISLAADLQHSLN